MVGASARAGRVLQVLRGRGVCRAGAKRLLESQPGAWVAAAVHEREFRRVAGVLALLFPSVALLLRLRGGHPPRAFAPGVHASDIHVSHNTPRIVLVEGGKRGHALLCVNSRVRDFFSGVSRRGVGLKSGTRLGAPLLALVAC